MTLSQVWKRLFGFERPTRLDLMGCSDVLSDGVRVVARMLPCFRVVEARRVGIAAMDRTLCSVLEVEGDRELCSKCRDESAAVVTTSLEGGKFGSGGCEGASAAPTLAEDCGTKGGKRPDATASASLDARSSNVVAAVSSGTCEVLAASGVSALSVRSDTLSGT